MARFAVPRSLLAQARLPSTALQSVAPRRHAHQVALIPAAVSAPNTVPSIPAPHSHAPSASTSSASGPTSPTAQDVPSSLSSADVFGRRISPSDELSMSRDCKSRVGDALRAGRDPLDAGQIYPTQDAALGSYYLFYSGVKQALPNLEPPPVLEPRTEVVDIPGQGKGVLARRAFQTGELVVAERPLLVMPAVDMSLSASVAKGSATSRTVTMRNWCLSGLIRDSMRPSDLDALAALHNAHSSSAQDYASIFNTNALSIPSLPGHDAPYGALCAHLARINHSCSPNAYWRWDLSSFSVHLYAARPIAEGEQLSIPYVSLLQPHAARQDTLLDRYIFRCTCSACRGTRVDRMAHDARRASLKAFTESPIAAGALSARASKAVVGAVQAARQEGYFFADVWSPALCYGARAAIALGDGESAARYARRAAKLASVVTGADGGWARLAMAPHRAKGWKAAVGAADEAGLSEVVDVLGDVPY